MKKFLALLMVLLVTASATLFASCGDPDDGGNGTQPGGDDGRIDFPIIDVD